MEPHFSLLFIGCSSMAQTIGEKLKEQDIKIKTDFSDSGKKAVSTIECGDYDLIISDYKTCDLSGTDLIKAIKEKCTDIPLGIIAGRDDEKDVLKDLYMGLEFSLISPADPYLAIEQIKTKISVVMEQKTAQEKLRNSERIIRDIFNSAEYIGIIATDENKVISFLSKGAQKLLGYDYNDVVGKETPAIFHIEEELSQRAKDYSEKTGKSIEGIDIFAEKMDEKGPERQEWTYKRKDGKLINVELTVTPIRDDAGNILGAFGIFYDITDKKKLEEDFKSYKIQSSGIITHIPNPTFAIDNQGKVIAWNQAIEDLTGIRAQDILGKGNYEYAIPFYGKRRPMLIDLLNEPEEVLKEQKYRDIEKTGNVISVETELFEIRGNYYYIRASASPISDKSGKIIGSIESISDLTQIKNTENALRESEAKIEYIIDSLPGMFYIFTEEGRFIRWNKNFEAITGYSAEEIKEMNPLDFTDEKYNESISYDIGKAFSEGFAQLETVIVTREGKKIPFLFSAYRKFIDGTPYILGLALDMTQAKEAEKEIKKLALIVQHSREFIGTTDMEGRGTFINEAGAGMIGINKDDVSNYKLEEIFRDDMKEKARTEIIPALLDKGLWEGDLVYQNFKNGNLIDVHAMTFTINDPETDEPEFLANVSLDITDRKRAEKALAREKANVEYIIDSLPGMFYMFYMFDESGRFVRWNKNLETLTGYSAEEVRNMKPLEFVDDNYKEQITEAIGTAFSKGYSDLEAVVATKDGKKIPFFFSANREIIDGDPYILGMGLDITKAKETEEEIMKLASVVRHSGEMISITSPEGIINFINKAGAKMVGAGKNDIIGRHFLEFIPDHLKEKINSEVLPTMDEKELWEGDLQYINKKTGNLVDVHAMTFTINDPETGTPAYLANVSLNISERKKAEAALKEVNKKLNLLGSITRHDILNQITVAQGYLDILEMDGLIPQDSKTEEFYRKILGAVETIRRQILFTKDYKDLGEQSPEWYNIGRIIENNYRNPGFQAIKLVNETGDLEVYADPLFEKVIYNLFDNAIKHGEKITTIKFYFRKSGDDMDFICEDDGAGIPEDVKEKIFRREYYKHTGLGLFLSREILSITGLSIEENGRYGEGARFVIHIPKGLFRFPG